MISAPKPAGDSTTSYRPGASSSSEKRRARRTPANDAGSPRPGDPAPAASGEPKDLINGRAWHDHPMLIAHIAGDRGAVCPLPRRRRLARNCCASRSARDVIGDQASPSCFQGASDGARDRIRTGHGMGHHDGDAGVCGVTRPSSRQWLRLAAAVAGEHYLRARISRSSRRGGESAAAETGGPAGGDRRARRKLASACYYPGHVFRNHCA